MPLFLSVKEGIDLLIKKKAFWTLYKKKLSATLVIHGKDKKKKKKSGVLHSFGSTRSVHGFQTYQPYFLQSHLLGIHIKPRFIQRQKKKVLIIIFTNSGVGTVYAIYISIIIQKVVGGTCSNVTTNQLGSSSSL